MKRTRYSEAQISFALLQADAGTPLEEVCRKLGIAEATLYRWKKRFAGLGVSETRAACHHRVPALLESQPAPPPKAGWPAPAEPVRHTVTCRCAMTGAFAISGMRISSKRRYSYTRTSYTRAISSPLVRSIRILNALAVTLSNRTTLCR